MAINIPGLIAIVFFYVVILVVGIWAGRKSNQVRRGTGEITIGEQSNIMLAGRNIGLFVGVFTMTATWVGGGYINGTAEIVYLSGLAWCQAPFGYALSLLIGGYLFAVRMRKAGYKTMLDPFQQHFGARMGCLLFIPALCGEVFWSAAILAALGATVEVIMDLQRRESVIASACIALFYTFTGGLYSVAYTDVIQLLAIFFGLWLCVPFAMFHEAVGPISYPKNDYVGSVTWLQFGKYWDDMLLLMMGGVPWQVYFQRVLSSRTAEGAELLSYMASFGCLFMAIPPVILGAVAKAANLTMAGYPKPFPLTGEDTALTLPLVLQYLTPKFVSAMGLGAVSAAVMSSSDSSILSAASMFAWNIYKLGIRQNASEKEVIGVMRVSIVLVGALATLMALTSQSIYGLWFLSSDLVYVILFPQLVCVVYLKDHVNTYGSLAAYIVGCFLRAGGGEALLGIPPFIKYPYYDYDEGKQRFPFRTFAMVLSFVALLVGSAASTWLFVSGPLPLRWDIFGCFTYTSPKPEETKPPAVIGADLKAPSKPSTTEKLPPKSEETKAPTVVGADLTSVSEQSAREGTAKTAAMPTSRPENNPPGVAEEALEKVSTASRRSASKSRRRSVGGPPADEKTHSGITEDGTASKRKRKKDREHHSSKASDKSDQEASQSRRRRSVGGPAADETTASTAAEDRSASKRKQKKRGSGSSSKKSDKGDQDAAAPKSGASETAKDKKGEDGSHLSASESKSEKKAAKRKR